MENQRMLSSAFVTTAPKTREDQLNTFVPLTSEISHNVKVITGL